MAPSGNTGKFGPGVAYAVEGKEYGPEAPVILQIGAEKAIDAFDYCAAMRLVRESYYAGYITERNMQC